MSQDLEKFGMPEEELFAPVDHSDLESEKITAPRYSYWHSVFRVFFKKKINIIILSILALLIAVTYIYRIFVASWIQHSLDLRYRCGRTVHIRCCMVWIKDLHFPCFYLCGDQPYRWCDSGIYLGILKESGCFYAGDIQYPCKHSIYLIDLCYDHVTESRFLDHGTGADHYRLAWNRILYPYAGSDHPRQRVQPCIQMSGNEYT